MPSQAQQAPSYPAEIIGYVEPWIASPEDTIDVKISSTEPELDYHVVRLTHGPQGLDFSNMKQEKVPSILGGSCRGRFQTARPGSYAIVERRIAALSSQGFEFIIHFQPHLVEEAKHAQVIASQLDVAAKTGFAALLNREGFLEFWIGLGDTVEIIHTQFKPVLKQWIKLQLKIDGAALRYVVTPRSLFTEIVASKVEGVANLGGIANFSGVGPVSFAASFAYSAGEACETPTNFFNGRLDGPTITVGGVICAKWDFSREISSDDIVDISPNGAHGRLVNAPSRAVTGHDWDAVEPDWTKSEYGYGAIHFHEDDLDDAAWETDFTIALPDTLRSGAYAVVVSDRHGRATDSVPFFVRPTASTTKSLGAKVVYILSTFTYLAYANEHVHDRTHLMSVIYNWHVRWDEHTKKTVRRNDLGLSCYDIYNDRSGVIHSTAKRPILNMRPDYISWNFHRPRGLSADLIGLEFLERSNIPYDVVCDHDLHAMGKDALISYSTVILASHPEYHTVESIRSFAGYLQQGGNLMYLGGNGLYWSCATKSPNLHRVEIRRGDQGCRAYTLPGGECVFSTNGQQGLLWRSRGLASNKLLGVGCCACGDGPGVPYKRTEASKDPTLAWMFKGITQEELIGVEGFGGGASGDEIDKHDLNLGSPSNTIVVATSTGHPDEFGIFPEDVEFPITETKGTETNEIRSDITYYETAAGGAVFSVGSINWFCSLGWNDYKNNVAQLTDNVLREFVRRSG